VVVRRYTAGVRNMRHLYLPLADLAMVYDNSDEGTGVIAERRETEGFAIGDPGRWSSIEEATR
jgi:predicted ABC-type ATPase